MSSGTVSAPQLFASNTLIVTNTSDFSDDFFVKPPETKRQMRLKYMGSKSWLAPHMDRLLGTSLCFTLPFGSGKLEYYLAARRPALEVHGVNAFEPVANLHRCFLKQDPVFLRSLLRLGAQSRQALLLQSPPAGHSERPRRASGRLLVRPAAQQLLRKVGLLHTAAAAGAEQRAAPTNVTVRRQDALAYLRALPRLAPRQAIYANPPYIFPGRSMNYYGTRRRGHDLAELRDALFASGLPFLASINDVPEAWELYSRAGSITRLCLGKNSSKPELLVVHRGNPAAGLKLQSCAQHRIARPAPGPHQARTRPAPGPHQAPVGFPTLVTEAAELRQACTKF